MALDVLVVDDSADIRKILTRVLAQTELAIGKVYEASDGVEALKMMEARTVGLVLSDINMPNLDGLQLLISVRSRPEWSGIPVIMISADGQQERVMEAVQMGAHGYIRKPFTAEEIKDKISACVVVAVK